MKISNTGPKPTGTPEPPEDIQKTNTAKEVAQTGATPAEAQTGATPAESASAKPTTGESAGAALKAAGDRMKSYLDSVLQDTKTESKDKGMTREQIAAELAKGQIHFAPPYVPVGPVVTEDNIPAPPAVKTTEMNLSPEQFQINDQGNLVITNEKLIDLFKSLKEGGQEFTLGITQKKKPGEE